MVYDKEKIRRLVDYKDTLIGNAIKSDLEWILNAYNEYFINSNDFEKALAERKTILQKYYNSEEEKENIKEELILLKRKYKVLKDQLREKKICDIIQIVILRGAKDMRKSYIADNIMREYSKKKRYEANKSRSELQKFIKENCKNCKNQTTDLCNISRNIDGILQCVFKEI